MIGDYHSLIVFGVCRSLGAHPPRKLTTTNNFEWLLLQCGFEILVDLQFMPVLVIEQISHATYADEIPYGLALFFQSEINDTVASCL